MALSLAFGGYVLAIEGFSASVAAALGGAGGTLGAFVVTGSVGRYVESWDREHTSHGRS